jgi:hypothetical protein
VLIEVAALGFGGKKICVDLDGYVEVIVDFAGAKFKPKALLFEGIPAQSVNVESTGTGSISPWSGEEQIETLCAGNVWR